MAFCVIIYEFENKKVEGVIYWDAAKHDSRVGAHLLRLAIYAAHPLCQYWFRFVKYTENVYQYLA